jgi:uncharacterized Zn-binding protein involved in type VI secretion
MPGVSRKSTDSAGGAISEGSSNVFVNGAAAVRIGDDVTPHGVGPHASPKMAEGSSTVFVNGKGCGRIGDAISGCTSVAEGSFNVFAGG